MTKLAFMASGNGTNAENLIQEIQCGRIPAEATMILCDKPGAGIFERAKRLEVKCVLVNRKEFETKALFEEALISELRGCEVDYIILAGFMRILSDHFVNQFLGRIINIHPSYLPDFKGAHAIQDAFEAKVAETGVTVHFVEPDVDSGPIILQRKVKILPEDSLESLETRVHEAEYEIYPEALRRVLSGEATYTGKLLP